MVRNSSTTEQMDQDDILSVKMASVPGRTDQRLYDERVAVKMANVISRSRRSRRETKRIISDVFPVIDRLLDQK